MNEVLKCIMSRGSIRAFEKREIPHADLELIAEAAIHAPTGMNKQLWQFTVLRNKELMNRLAAAIGKALQRDDYNFYNPDTLILTSNERDNPHRIEDCACAMENIYLAAHSLGIGCVWINQLKGICDEPEIRALLREIGVPDNHIVLGSAALGFPAAGPRDIERKRSIVWCE